MAHRAFDFHKERTSKARGGGGGGGGGGCGRTRRTPPGYGPGFYPVLTLQIVFEEIKID